MYRTCLKSEVYENQIPPMWSSKDMNGAKTAAPNSNTIGDWSPTDCKESEEEEQLHLRSPRTIVIVEPRQIRTTPTSTRSTSSTSSSNPEWFMLPHTVDTNNDVMRLVSSLSTVVQILTRMTNAAAQELRQHPEREEGFQGLRMLLNYADQMYTTLLQSYPLERTASPRNVPSSQSHSLFHHLFDPMRIPLNRGEDSSPRHSERLPTHRSYPYRVVAVADNGAEIPESDESLDLAL